jgi:hypothetical protein
MYVFIRLFAYLGNVFGSVGISSLAANLNINQSLRLLDVSENNLGDEGVVILGKTIAKNEALEVIKMQGLRQ